MSRLAATAACAALASAALALAVRSVGQWRAPQVAAGDDALAVAFGDARVAIGQAMFQKADSYFHGGIDMEAHDCEMDAVHEHHHDHDADDDDEYDEEAHERSEHDADEASEAVPTSSAFDPWRWINSHVRAPQVERHLRGAKAVEMMPWFWASVRSDPHNIDAWTTTWYVAYNVMKDKDLAWRVIEEGKAKNPESLEIALYEARHVFGGGHGDVAKATRMFEEVRDRALARCGGDEEQLKESDRYMLRYARNYLDAIAKPYEQRSVHN